VRSQDTTAVKARVKVAVPGHTVKIHSVSQFRWSDAASGAVMTEPCMWNVRDDGQCSR